MKMKYFLALYLFVCYTNLVRSQGYDLSESLIFCCDDEIEDNSRINVSAAPLRLRISERKCQEYSQCEDNFGRRRRRQIGGWVTVVGGYGAEPGEFPHMAALGWKLVSGPDYVWLCGSSLINEQFVLTAAHCTSTRRDDVATAAPTIARFGSIYNHNKGGDVQEIGIANIITHPQWVGLQRYHDIALMKLVTPVKFSSVVRPLCLWQQSVVPNITSIATGWGQLNSTGEISNVLQRVDLFFSSQEECRAAFPVNRRLRNGIIGEQLCAGDPKGGKDTCQGDSGGPLVVRATDKLCLYHQVGITSFGTSCGTTKPAVYTRISSYLDWIEATAWPNN